METSNKEKKILRLIGHQMCLALTTPMFRYSTVSGARVHTAELTGSITTPAQETVHYVNVDRVLRPFTRRFCHEALAL